MAAQLMAGALVRLPGDEVYDRVRPAAAGPEPGFLETFGAASRVTVDETSAAQQGRRREAYEALTTALGELGVPRGELLREHSWTMGLPAPGGSLDYDKVWAAAQRLRARDRQALRDIGDDRDGWEQGVLGRGGEWRRDQLVLGRRSGVAAFAGSAVTDMADSSLGPLQFMVGGGSTVVRAMLMNGAIGLGDEAVRTPERVRNRAALGEEMSGAEVALNLGGALVAPALLTGAGHVVGKVIAPRVAAGQEALLARLIPHLPEGLRPKISGLADIPDLHLADAVEGMVGRDNLTPDMSAALAAVRREGEIAASNPFVGDFAGLKAHGEQLQAAMDRIMGEAPERSGRARLAGSTGLRGGSVAGPALASPASGRGAAPRGGGALDSRIVGFFESKGYSPAQARGIAAGIHAESRSDPNVRGGYQGRALGIGQWLGPRRAAIIRQYGENPTLDQQLDFMHRELQGGDAGGRHVLAAASEEQALHAYITKFMRPAAGAETTGDLSRGMAALGRKGEVLRDVSDGGAGQGAAAGGDDGLALETLRAEQELAAADAALSGERGSLLDAGTVQLGGPLPEDMPTLKPEFERRLVADGLRALIPDRAVSLNDTARLAEVLGSNQGAVREALDSLVGAGHLKVTANGVYRRLAAPGTRGPEDMLQFIALRGGLAYDGLGSRGRLGGSAGHDLRNSGNLAAFVPGAGPLLRPGGRGLDDMGELLHDAGYFGPPEVTPRPTEAELITLLDDVIRKKEKRYSSFDQLAPEAGKASDFAPPSEGTLGDVSRVDYYAHWDAVAERAGTKTFLPDEVAAIERAMRSGSAELPPLDPAGKYTPEELAPYVHEMVNREIDDVMEASFAEIEDPFYDAFPPDLAREAGAAESGGGGRAAVGGNPRAGEAGAGAGRGTGAQAGLGTVAGELDPAQLKMFDAPDGPGVKALAASLEHDAQTQQARLLAAAPLRGENRTGLAQDGMMGSPLFDAADQPSFQLDEAGPAQSLAEVLAEFDAEAATIKAIRDCL